MNTSRPSEHTGGIINCEDKRAPIVVTLGQQYHVGAFFCGTVHLLMAITKLRSDAFATHFFCFLSFIIIVDHSLLLHVVLLTDAVAVHDVCCTTVL